MQKILRKRIFRDLRENLFRYLALAFMIILGMYMVISLVAAADTIIKGTAEMAAADQVEDGQFDVFVPLTEKETESFEKDGVTLEEHFYLDYTLADDSMIRVFTRREKIDLVQVDSGTLPEKSGEILLERRYCEEHKISAGDPIRIGNLDFTVSGIGTAPDYESPLRNLSDSAVDSEQFGIGFVTEEDYRLLKNDGESVSAEEYSYAYRLNGNITQEEFRDCLQDLEVEADDIEDEYFQEYWERTGGRLDKFMDTLDTIPAGFLKFADEAREFLDENVDVSISKMTQFTTAEANPRIGAAADDKLVDHAAGLAAGVIVLILFAYVISVFTVHSIEREAGIIGTLYAMGVKKNELLRHYLALPVSIAFLAGVIGTALGCSGLGVEAQMSEPYGYFSIPRVEVIYEPYLLLYGLFMPPLAAALTNYLVIRRKLDRPALALIRGEQKYTKTQNITLKGSFVHVFRIRQLLRERRTAFTVFFGMFISLLVVMLSLNCYTLCVHIKTENKEDTKFEYMYTLKYPEETVPEGGEEAFGVTMKKEVLGYHFDVTLLGIHEENPYFDADVKKGENRVMISSALAQKYRLDVGDILTLSDEENSRNYAFTVDGIVKYSTGFFAFMEIDSMRELLGENREYYNIVFSDHDLQIDSGRLYSTLSKEGIEKSASVFVAQMISMVVTLLAASALIFVMVMYLMMKVMIDRSALSISMFKVFGYRKKEIGKLYLSGNLFIAAVSAAVGIPLSKAVMDGLFPYMVSNVACGLNLTFSWQMYAGIYMSILVLCFIINQTLMLRVNKILPAEVLKNRE